MIAYNAKPICEEAQLYYYDFLFSQSHEQIPESITNHLENCHRCKNKMDQLKQVLAEDESSPDSKQQQIDSSVVTMMRLHFEYIGQGVTCKAVKPFLPSMLDPDLAIRIPTPITAHLDNCQNCSDDLESIRNLNLGRKHLCCLSQLFAEGSRPGTEMCKKARRCVPLVVAMIFGEISAEVLKHLCICPYCRRFVYERREMVRKELVYEKRIQKEFPCQQLSVDDIFDYAIPYGVDPTNDQYVKFRESLNLHLRACPTCLAKMQQLHKIVYAIAERPESEVVTIYHLDESAKEKAFSDSTDTYAGFPIRVDVIGQDDKDKIRAQQPVPTISFTAALKQKISSSNFKPLVKTAVAAAAVILIATALFLGLPTAEAVTIEQIYKAIEKIENAYILIFDSAETEAKQQIWVSRTLNIYMTKTGIHFVLWDIDNHLRKDKNLYTGKVKTTPLTTESLASVKRKMSGSLGLMPFYNMSEIPADAKWKRVIAKHPEIAATDTDVYELIWSEKTYEDFARIRKWRVFVNPRTNLPKQTEFYEKSPDKDEYVLESVKVVEYLSDSEMQLVLEEVSF